MQVLEGCMGLQGFRVGFGVQDSGLRFRKSGFKVSGLGFGVDDCCIMAPHHHGRGHARSKAFAKSCAKERCTTSASSILFLVSAADPKTARPASEFLLLVYKKYRVFLGEQVVDLPSIYPHPNEPMALNVRGKNACDVQTHNSLGH